MKKLEEILHEGNLVDYDTLNDALLQSQSEGSSLEEILVANEVLSEDQIAFALASELQLPFISTENFEISEELIQEIPKKTYNKASFFTNGQTWKYPYYCHKQYFS